jgi:hypothetical protein
MKEDTIWQTMYRWKSIAYEAYETKFYKGHQLTICYCKHGDELGQINGEEFLYLVSDCRFFKKDSVLQQFDMIQILVPVAMLVLS